MSANLNTPWRAAGLNDIRDVQGKLVGMTNPTRHDGGYLRTSIILRANAHDPLVEALTRLVREADLDGMRQRAGWDCWLSLADVALKLAETPDA